MRGNKIPLLLILLFPLLSFAEESMYMGVGSCSSSNCHGSVSPRKASNVLQNEFATWHKHDAHAKAYLNLGSEDSRIMANHLGIKDPQKEPACLSCHSTYVPQAVRGERFQLEDGVGCESCHGAAQKWLDSHADKGIAHQDNLRAGLADLVSLEKRAAVCANCHFGSDKADLTHRIMGAGHPRIAFELDTFTALMPAHWEYDADYGQRKSDYDGVRAWILGQYELAQRSIQRLSSERRSKAGLWPELTLFYCYSCHHDLEGKQFREADYLGRPGELRVNLASILILSEVCAAALPQVAPEIQEVLLRLRESLSNGDKVSAVLDELSKLFEDKVFKAISSLTFDKRLNQALLERLVVFAATSGHVYYEDAEQLVMGISSLLAARYPSGNPYKSNLDALYAAVENPSRFSIAAFKDAAQKFKLKL